MNTKTIYDNFLVRVVFHDQIPKRNNFRVLNNKRL